MRVLHLIPDNARRGTQLFARDLAAALRPLGIDSTLMAMELCDDREQGLDVDVLGKASGTTGRWGLRTAMKGYDVTVAHGPDAGVLVADAAKKTTPFVYRQIRDTRFWQRRPPRPKKVPAYFRDASAVVALSPGSRNDLLDLLEVPGSKVHVIPTGVPSNGFHMPTGDDRVIARSAIGVDPDEFVAMTLGALVPEKGIDVAIRAFIEMPDARLVVVGDGPERERLERLVNGLAEPGRVVFTGYVVEKMSVLAAADVLVHPSLSAESIPAALIEAGYCGLPAIATPIGSVESVVIDGRTGLLVPPNDVQGLRAAVEVLRVGRVGRQMMGEAARVHCLNRFEIDVVAAEWARVFEKLVGAGR